MDAAKLGHRIPSDAYRRETELLMARRLPLLVALFLGFLASSGILEYRYHPERGVYFLIFLAAQAALGTATVVSRRFLLRRNALTAAAATTATAFGLLMIGYNLMTRAESQTLGTALVCLLTGLSLLLPWGVRGQVQVAAAVLLGFLISVTVDPPSSIPPLYAFFGVFSGAFISVLGAQFLDIHRYAIFREIVLKDEAAHVTQALLQITGELNSSLEASTVLERIASSARDALACDWGMILLWDERRQGFRVANGVSDRNNLLDELRGIEFGPDKFPIVKRLLVEDLIEVSDAHPGDDTTTAMMKYFQTQSMLAAPMLRGGRVVGLMMAGRFDDSRAFLPHQTRLTRGIAQQAAVALENARLLGDLRYADRLKSEFVATMSHELRTPLNIILGYNEMLETGALGAVTPEQQDVIARIRQHSLELTAMVDATLDINRLEAGNLPIEVEEIRIADFVSQIRSEMERLPHPDGVALEWRVGGDATLRSDPKKLRIILRNLIVNALKFTDQGRVDVSVQPTPDNAVEFAVADTGIGIAEAELPHIFGMFEQVKSDFRQTSGVGLGLYIVQRFVDQLNGRIAVRSNPGIGSRFQVIIPNLGRQEAAAQQPQAGLALGSRTG